MTKRAQDDSSLPGWNHLQREPWMRIARRDPPPGFDASDFDDAQRRKKALSPEAQQKAREARELREAAAKGRGTPNEPWLRHKIKKKEAWERESWMTIAKRDPPPITYTAPKKKEVKKPTIKSDVENAKADAKRRMDEKMRSERPGGKVVVVQDPMPDLPAFLRREKWSAIARRDPPPLHRVSCK
jgi:hypothetical protein